MVDSRKTIVLQPDELKALRTAANHVWREVFEQSMSADGGAALKRAIDKLDDPQIGDD